MRIGRIVWSAVFVTLAASAVQAQVRREIGFFLGTTSSTGISSNDVTPTGKPPIFVEAKPRNGFTWGVDFGYLVRERLEVGVLYSIQKSELQFAVGTAWTNVGAGMDVQNVMGTFAYNTGYYKSTTRFYVLGGLGMTRYGNVTLTTIDGKDAQIGGRSKFATTWGAGVKYRVNPMIGLKGQIRYTPTNIKDTADDWLCSPYWPATCTAGGVNHQFASQLEFSVGALLRF